MSKTIIQKVVFKNTKAHVLYDVYMNSKKHSAATGAPTNIANKVGTKFTAHGDYITGENLQLLKDKLIVQSWRASDWSAEDPDSVFIINFEEKGNDTILNIVHANLPDEHAQELDQGWHEYYWKPMRAYL